MQIAHRIQNISASLTLSMAAKARELKATGIDVISMSLGEPDMDTPVHIRQAAKQAVEDGWSHYGPVAGILSLRAAIAKQQNDVIGNSIAWNADDVMVSVGAKMAIYNAIQTAINPGDEVIIPMPSWVSYSEMVKLAQGNVVPVETKYEDNYCMTPEQLLSALTPKTRMLILCSPNNPTGAVYNRKNLEALVAVLRNYPEVIVLSDEIYASLSYDMSPMTLSAFEPLADRLIIVNGVSKAYAMTGYRIGWMMTKNQPFINACIRLQGQQLTCATMIAQKAAETALTGSQQCVEEMRKVFEQRRDLICRLASEIPGWKFEKPQGAFYLFPDVSAIGSGSSVAEMLLEKAHVAVVPGEAFGCPACIRLSYAISTQQIEQAMRRIKNVLTK